MVGLFFFSLCFYFAVARRREGFLGRGDGLLECCLFLGCSAVLGLKGVSREGFSHWSLETCYPTAVCARENEP